MADDIDTPVGEIDGSEHQAAADEAEASASEESELTSRIHALVMGRPGMGKTHLGATWEKPILWLLWDPVGKEQPLWDRCKRITPFQKAAYCYYREGYGKNDKFVARCEYWSEPNPAKPSAIQRWITRSVTLEEDISTWGIKTVVFDTSTFFELAARVYSQYVVNASNGDRRIDYNFSMSQCEQHVMMRIPNLLPVHSLVLSHEEDQKDESDQDAGTVIRTMAAFPGKLPNRVAGAFTEVWHIYVARDGKTRLLQTQRRATNNYDCKSLLHLPDPISAHFEAIKKAVISRG